MCTYPIPKSNSHPIHFSFSQKKKKHTSFSLFLVVFKRCTMCKRNVTITIAAEYLFIAYAPETGYVKRDEMRPYYHSTRTGVTMSKPNNATITRPNNDTVHHLIVGIEHLLDIRT